MFKSVFFVCISWLSVNIFDIQNIKILEENEILENEFYKKSQDNEKEVREVFEDKSNKKLSEESQMKQQTQREIEEKKHELKEVTEEPNDNTLDEK